MLREIALLSKNSRISGWSAVYKLAVFLTTPVILSFDRDGLTSSLVNFGVVILAMRSLKVPLESYIRFTKGLLLFLILGSVSVSLESGIYPGLVLVARGISSSASIYLFSATTPIDDLFWEISKKQSVREIAEVGSSMLRLSFMFEDEFKQTKLALESRCGFTTLRGRVVNTGKLAGAVLRGALRNWREMEHSLKSRGYRGRISFKDREYIRPKAFLIFGTLYNLAIAFIANKT